MQQELTLAIEAAHAAGRAIRSLYGRAVQLGDKGPAGIVTEADLASNTCIQTMVQRAFPHDGWLSEETVDNAARLHNPRVWIIDPLDGTWEFATGVPEFVVSIGFCLAGEAVVGVLYNPITEETFAGLRGEGAWLNDRPTSVSPATSLAASTFCVSRTEAGKGAFAELSGHLRLQPKGSIAYKCGLVATGRYEGVFTHNPRNEWDICAGVAIIEAAGGCVTDRNGRPYRFNRPDPLQPPLVGTNRHLHDDLLAVLRSTATSR
jgi:myo-inositol-1(or 4)-monophosphatase